MRIVFKLIAAPFALALILLSAVLAFVHSASGKIFGAASVIIFLGSFVLMASGETVGGLAFAAAAFLISPFGLYAVAGRLVDLLGSAGGALRGFIAR